VTPRWSIVIPTFRRPQLLAVCLQSLAELDYPRDAYEVIVVNDGGEPLDAVAHAFAPAMSPRVIDQPNAGPGAARNRGAAEARGELLAFTDDDCTPEPRWLANLESQLSLAPDCMVGGRVINILSGFRNVCSAASQSLASYLYTYYNRDPEHARFFTSNNMGIARRSFVDFGGFDIAFHRASAEDREFCDRWIGAGRRLIYVPDAVVLHAHTLSLSAFARQHFVYGRGALHFRHARAARDAGPVRVEPMDFYTRLLTHPWREGQPHAMTTMSLLFLSQAANAAGFFFEKFFGPPLPPASQSGARRQAAAEGRST
jgi:GT2 family glycosyltransferase